MRALNFRIVLPTTVTVPPSNDLYRSCNWLFNRWNWIFSVRFFFPKKNVDKPRTYPYDLFQGVKNLHVKGAKSMPVQGRLKPLPILRTRLLKRFVLMLQVMKVFKML